MEPLFPVEGLSVTFKEGPYAGVEFMIHHCFKDQPNWVWIVSYSSNLSFDARIQDLRRIE